MAEGEDAVGTRVTEEVAAASGMLAPLCVGVRSERQLECAQARTERRRAGGQTQVCLPPKEKTCWDGSGVCSICPEVVRL